MAILARAGCTPAEATLCGRVLRADDDARFSAADQARDWIQHRLHEINRSDVVHLEWVKGAHGKEKEMLYQAAHVFVLPTRYPVESQPITILEALASGCAVITTKVGEIPTTVDEGTAILLDDGSAASIADAVTLLWLDGQHRQQLALKGLALFMWRFSHSQYLDRWEALLSHLAC